MPSLKHHADLRLIGYRCNYCSMRNQTPRGPGRSVVAGWVAQNRKQPEQMMTSGLCAGFKNEPMRDCHALDLRKDSPSRYFQSSMKMKIGITPETRKVKDVTKTIPSR
jgi:hypothetical protein